MSSLADRITTLFLQGTSAPRDEARDVFFRLRDELSLGKVRAAEPDAASPTGWRVNVWVKQGILLGFRFGDIVDMGVAKGRWSFYDKDTLPMKRFDSASGVRVVPGGSAVREGAYLAPGGNCGVYEGAIIRRRAVLASGTIITGSTPIYDLPNSRIIKPEAGQPLIVPEGAVVVPGSRAVTVGAGKEWGLSLATPVIVKYRDERTDARTELERWLR